MNDCVKCVAPHKHLVSCVNQCGLPLAAVTLKLEWLSSSYIYAVAYKLLPLHKHQTQVGGVAQCLEVELYIRSNLEDNYSSRMICLETVYIKNTPFCYLMKPWVQIVLLVCTLRDMRGMQFTQCQYKTNFFYVLEYYLCILFYFNLIYFC